MKNHALGSAGLERVACGSLSLFSLAQPYGRCGMNEVDEGV